MARKFPGTVSRAGVLLEVVAMGQYNPGNVTTSTVRLRGVVATDHVITQLHTKGSTPRTILTARCLKGAIEVVGSGAFATDHEITYVVLRDASATPKALGAPVRTAGG